MAMQERALVTRDQLLLAAAEEIHRVGYREATIAAISSAAGVTTGASYFHFKSKEDLARALIEKQHQIVRDAAQVILADAHEPALNLMMRMCADLARRLVDDPIVRAGIRLTTDQSTFESPVQQPYRDWLETFTMLAHRAEHDGETTGEIPAETLANFIIPAFTGVQLVSEMFSKRVDLIDRVHAMWEILIRATVPPASQVRMITAADQVFAAPPPLERTAEDGAKHETRLAAFWRAAVSTAKLVGAPNWGIR